MLLNDVIRERSLKISQAENRIFRFRKWFFFFFFNQDTAFESATNESFCNPMYMIKTKLR